MKLHWNVFLLKAGRRAHISTGNKHKFGDPWSLKNKLSRTFMYTNIHVHVHVQWTPNISHCVLIIQEICQHFTKVLAILRKFRPNKHFQLLINYTVIEVKLLICTMYVHVCVCIHECTVPSFCRAFCQNSFSQLLLQMKIHSPCNKIESHDNHMTKSINHMTHTHNHTQTWWWLYCPCLRCKWRRRDQAPRTQTPSPSWRW